VGTRTCAARHAWRRQCIQSGEPGRPVEFVCRTLARAVLSDAVHKSGATYRPSWQMRHGGNNNTVLRAGTGIFYDSAQSEFESLDASPTSLYTYSNFAIGKYPTGAESLRSRQLLAVVAAPGYTLPRTYEWNVTMEQSFAQQTFSAAYTGAVGRRLLGTFLGPIYILSAIEPPLRMISGNFFSGSYHALQLQFNRRIGKRVQALLSYTWSHSIDNLSDQTGQSLGFPMGRQGTTTLLEPNLNRGDSDFDVRQSLHGALFFALPAPHVGQGAALLRNWTASTIFFARTALPTTVLTFKDLGYVVRPNLVPGQPLYLYASGYPGGKSFNGAAFAAPDGVERGNLGRNALRGFGAWQADLALHREFRLSEHTTVQFRGEAFNVFNHPNFGNPGGWTAYPLGAGALLSRSSLAAGLSAEGTLGELNHLFQVGGSRSLQLALRLRF